MLIAWVRIWLWHYGLRLESNKYVLTLFGVILKERYLQLFWVIKNQDKVTIYIQFQFSSLPGIPPDMLFWVYLNFEKYVKHQKAILHSRVVHSHMSPVTQ